MAKLKTGRHTSAIKAQRQAERRALRSRSLKRKGRDASKALLAAKSSGDKTDKTQVQKLLSSASSAWDKAAKKGAIHWKTAARRKARLAAAAAK
jgi:small subunit ribosomal protein S20